MKSPPKTISGPVVVTVSKDEAGNVVKGSARRVRSRRLERVRYPFEKRARYV